MSETTDYTSLNQETKSLLQEFGKASPAFLKAFQGMHHSAIQDGALDAKTKELVALGISIHGQCDRCIGMHVTSALKEGATADEIRETAAVAAMMGGGPGLMYALNALKALKDLDV